MSLHSIHYSISLKTYTPINKRMLNVSASHHCKCHRSDRMLLLKATEFVLHVGLHSDKNIIIFQIRIH